MNRKLWIAVALALVGLAYLAVQPKGDTPATVNDDRPATIDVDEAQLEAIPGEPSVESGTSSLGQTGAAPTAEDNGMAGKLVESLHADKDIVAVAVINSVECAENSCTVELEAKGEENVQGRMLNFLRAHPEFGTNFKVAQGDNPKVTQFILGQSAL